MMDAARQPQAPAGAAWTAPRTQQVDHGGLIQQSHRRCQALGLTRIERPDFEPLLRSDLAEARERNRRLFTHAAPVMEMLFEQIVDSQSMIVLADAQGTILHSVGDDRFLERAGKVALAPGVNWAEQSKGTNAIGTALVEETPTVVHAGEHFIHANSFLTCSAAPIFDPRGNMLGVLDVTGDQHSYHQHTMGLVRMSARMIENQWLSDDYGNRLRLHFHSRPEFIGTLMEGIVVVGADGRIVGANRSALDQLDMSSAALRMQSITSLFGTTAAAMIDHFRAPLPTPALLSLPNGRQFHATARFSLPAPALAMAGLERSAGMEPLPRMSHGAASDPAARTGPGQGMVAGPGRATAGGPVSSAGDSAAKVAGQPGSALSGLHYLRTGDPLVGAVIQKVQRILNADIPLLVLGETGTGKELLAHAVHQDSNRARQAFVAVNCASIPESLIEAELFGYEDGAFTGARRKGAVGRIVQANGGTLFLDEIGDMPLALQARLLRVLQERSVTPLGSQKSVPVDIAVIGATHRNLREMIAAGTFREDLYYRLNGLVVRLPALRERSDLAIVARRILQTEAPQCAPAISHAVMAMFARYHWPGNLRQLANVLRTAAVMAAGESEITEAHLPDDFLEDLRQMAAPVQPQGTWTPPPQPMAPASHQAGWKVPQPPARTPPQQAAWTPPQAPAWLPPQPEAAPSAAVTPPAEARTLGEAEIAMIRQAVDAAEGNISLASKRLGISRNTIYRKLRWGQGGPAREGE